VRRRRRVAERFHPITPRDSEHFTCVTQPTYVDYGTVAISKSPLTSSRAATRHAAPGFDVAMMTSNRSSSSCVEDEESYRTPNIGLTVEGFVVVGRDEHSPSAPVDGVGEADLVL